MKKENGYLKALQEKADYFQLQYEAAIAEISILIGDDDGTKRVKRESIIVKNIIAEHYSINAQLLANKTRRQEVMAARQMYCLLMYERRHTLAGIAKTINRTHATIINSKNRMIGFIEVEEASRKDYIYLSEKIKNALAL